MSFSAIPGLAEPGMFSPGLLESGSTAVTGADTGSQTASTQAIVAALTGTDTGSSTVQTFSITATLASADTGSSTEAHSIAVTLTGSDTGSGLEAHALAVALSGSDTGSGVEDQSYYVNVSDTDTGSSAEDFSTLATLSDDDTGTSVEDQSVDDIGEDTPDGFDTGTGTEDQGTNASLVHVDNSPQSLEFHDLVASISGADTGSGAEGPVVVHLSSSDTATGVEGTETFDRRPASDDFASASESESIVVHLSSADSAHGSDAHQPFPAGPVEIGDYIVSLVMGPATIYVADFSSPEPLDSDIATSPNTLVWKDIGTTLDGVVMKVKHEFETPEQAQNPVKSASRLKRRHVSVDLKMAEPTLINMLYALNSGSVTTGPGYQSYSPPFVDRATPLTYRAIMIDGWAPGFSDSNDNLHRRRRVILRKCLSVDDASLAYTKDDLTACPVTWTVHRVDGVTTPFKVIDEE